MDHVKADMKNARSAITEIKKYIDSIDIQDSSRAMLVALANNSISDLNNTFLRKIEELFEQYDVNMLSDDIPSANEDILEVCFSIGVATQLVSILPPHDSKPLISASLENLALAARDKQNQILKKLTTDPAPISQKVIDPDIEDGVSIFN